MVLKAETWVHALVSGEAFRFSGDDAVICSLPQGTRRLGEEWILARYDLLDAGKGADPLQVGPGGFALIRIG